MTYRPLPVAASDRRPAVQPTDNDVLRERAIHLATKPAAAPSYPMTPLLVFTSGGQRFAMEISKIAGVVRPGPSCSLDWFDAPWTALSNVRGRLTPILDLGRHMGLSPSGPAEGQRLVLLAVGETSIAIAADEVEGIVHHRLDALAPAQMGTMSRAGAGGIVRGVTPDLAVVIDATALLTDPGLVVDDAPT